MPPAAEKTEEVARRLQAAYRTESWRPDGDPVSELVATVLSQHTSDVNTARAFASLRSAFPTWASVEAAPVADLAAAIRCGGLAETKAPRIQQILAAVRSERAGYDLGHLGAMPLAEARRWLTSLPGVGPKTASCVLLFALGKPAFPVDTHVHRLTRRIGLVAPNASPERVQDAVEARIGDAVDEIYRLHLNLIELGRAVCAARAPRCAACVLRDLCDFAANREGALRLGAPHPPAASG